MSKRKKYYPYFSIERGLFETKEFRGLSSGAVHVYILMRAKFNGSNADDISLTYSEMNGVMGTQKFLRAKEELIEAKIISIKRDGYFCKIATLYSLRNPYWPLNEDKKR